MAHDPDPSAVVPASSTHLHYAIHSARAVVQALIARDQAAVEEVALRTCHDCELLIRLIRDLVSLLRDPINKHLGLNPAEVEALARRADHVLALINDQAAGEPSSVQPKRTSEGVRGEIRKQDGGSSVSVTPSGALKPPDQASHGTVASTGLRVRLVPVDENSTRPPADDKQDSCPTATPGDRPRDTLER